MAKTKTKRNSNNQRQHFLKLLLLSKKYTIKDLKCEVILLMCDMLIENYLEAEKQNKIKLILEDFTESDSNIIKNNLEDLQNEIRTHCIPISSIQYLINNYNRSEDDLIRAKLSEPISYFYNIAVNSLKSKMLSQNEEKNNLQWIPDLICIHLILDMELENYYFSKFDFLKKFDFEKLILIYQKTNIKLKEKDGISLFSKDKNKITIINKMQNISSTVVKSLINSKYK
jgi:hypothetical protein